VIIPITGKEELNAAMAQAKMELMDMPNGKIQVVDTKDGAQLWYANVGAEADDIVPGLEVKSPFFKSYTAEAAASFMHVVKSTGHPIEQLEVDVFSAKAGRRGVSGLLGLGSKSGSV
jgi:hypothetical protein